jgi:hypothetical protein
VIWLLRNLDLITRSLRHGLAMLDEALHDHLDDLLKVLEGPGAVKRTRRGGLAGERGRREILERDLAELKRHVAALQSRIEDIEQRLGR